MKRSLGRVLLVGLLLLTMEWNGGVRASAQSGQIPELGWSYVPVDGTAYGLGMSVDGDTLVAVIGFGFDPGGQIVSLDPVNGNVRWVVETPEGAAADPIVVDGVVYAGMGNLVGGGAAIYALDVDTGEQRWRADVENRSIPATPIDAIVHADGQLYVNRGDAVLLKLAAASGSIEWEVDLEKPSRGAPVVAGDTVYVATGFDGARILAIDAATGEERWRVDQPENPVTGPVLAGGLLLVSSTSGELVALDPATGEERWRAYIGEYDEEVGMDPNPGLPLFHDGRIYLSSNGFAGAVTVALDAATGGELWSMPTGDFSAGAPAFYGETLLVGSDSGDMFALDPATGSELWRIAVPNKLDLDLDQSSPPLVGGHQIFVRDELGSVVAIGGRSLRSEFATREEP